MWENHSTIGELQANFTTVVSLTTIENIGPLWRRKYYVIPPQGLCNITSSIEAHNNRNVNHHSVITIDDDVTLNCQKLWWRL